MPINLHPNAAANFDKEGQSLFDKRVEYQTATPPPFEPETHKTVAEGDFEKYFKVTIVMTEARDSNGDMILILFKKNGKATGLLASEYRRLQEIAKKIQRTGDFRDMVSTKAIIGGIAQWLTQKCQDASTPTLIRFLVPYCEALVTTTEIWVPIAATHIQGELELGTTKIRTITATMWNDWWNKRVSYVLQYVPERMLVEEQMFDRNRKDTQGLAACVVAVTAEGEMAKEIAYKEAHLATGFLRFFSPANFSCEAVSHSLPLGQENIRRTRFLSVQNEAIWTITSSVEDLGQWSIDGAQLDSMKREGLSKVNELLNRQKRTPFAESLLSALSLYGKSSVAHDLRDKLLYIITPLESLLVRDGNESLSQNVAERLALVVASDPSEREAVGINYKEVYAARSRFVHHGRGDVPLEKMEKFMKDAWSFLQQTLQRVDEFESKDDFIKAIDRLKFSGGSF